MLLYEKCTAFAERLNNLRDSVKTEEAMKTAFVLPFLQALGYDVFNPLEVIPEYTLDHGVKKAEKVDYAIRVAGLIAVLMECKQLGAPLSSKQASQLFRYFTVSEAKFAILTDGARYLFFTDLAAPNKMDEEPFFEFNLLNFTHEDVLELSRFAKSVFNAEAIQLAASNLRVVRQLQAELRAEFESPSEDLMKLFFSRLNPGARFTAQANTRFSVLVKKAVEAFRAELAGSAAEDDITVFTEATVLIRKEGVETTQDERDALALIQQLVADYAPPDDVVLRDAKSYCAILFQNNNRKPIARLYFNRSGQKQIGLFASVEETRYPLDSVADIQHYADMLRATIVGYQAIGESKVLNSSFPEQAMDSSAPAGQVSAAASPVEPSPQKISVTVFGMGAT